MRGLKNKRVVITGGASGIGAATAARFVEEGARVVVLDRDEAGCARLRNAQPELTGAIVADVSDPDSVARGFLELDNLLFAFLASDESPYITGSHVVIDGGETAGGLASR